MPSQDYWLALHRVEFGLSAAFHFLFVPLSIGLLFGINVLHSHHAVTRREASRQAARFWLRYFLLSWLVGAATGYALRHQLREQWSLFGDAAAPVLARVLQIEGAIGPWMLAAVALLAFGQRWLHPLARAVTGWFLFGLMTTQAHTILSVNAWMQQPVGFDTATARWQIDSLSQVLLSDTAINKTIHTLLASLLTGAFFMLAVASRDLTRHKTSPVWTTSVQVAAWVAPLSALCLLASGHASTLTVSQTQPMKFATFEAHWKATPGAAPLILFAVPDDAGHYNAHEWRVPALMSWLIGRTQSPPGIDDLNVTTRLTVLQALKQADRPGHEPWRLLRDQVAAGWGPSWNSLSPDRQAEAIAEAARPPLWPVFVAFRVMVGAGLLLSVLSCWVFSARHQLAQGKHRRLLKLLRLAWPLPWIAILSGWMVAEIGRQPWTIYQHFTTARSFQAPSFAIGMFTVFALLAGGTVLSGLCLLIARLIRRAGPECESWLVFTSPPRLGQLRHKLRSASASPRT